MSGTQNRRLPDASPPAVLYVWDGAKHPHKLTGTPQQRPDSIYQTLLYITSAQPSAAGLPAVPRVQDGSEAPLEQQHGGPGAVARIQGGGGVRHGPVGHVGRHAVVQFVEPVAVGGARLAEQQQAVREGGAVDVDGTCLDALRVVLQQNIAGKRLATCEECYYLG